MTLLGARQSFAKSVRLLRHTEFRQVYERGHRRGGTLCTVFFRPNGLSCTRLGITVTSRLGKAVVRNRVRRRIREAFRLHRAQIPVGWDIVVNARDPVVQAPFPRLASELLRLFPHASPGPVTEAPAP